MEETAFRALPQEEFAAPDPYADMRDGPDRGMIYGRKAVWQTLCPWVTRR
ncbi:predicted protein [Streptomyces viridosporus ATCC 14672]|uniref:Predicted protein n=1 Tax=Streptomyces viridosporus (strain ATCC 14672 / DSM 40746 / JCM 4963 / KCTC 9882 / NRRL B-12104 / FH 1290) TaxID=566461 RepID=D6A816_STRV1|nr:predicted protein [Streptomyces viridosporus ATCC 14672]